MSLTRESDVRALALTKLIEGIFGCAESVLVVIAAVGLLRRGITHLRHAEAFSLSDSLILVITAVLLLMVSALFLLSFVEGIVGIRACWTDRQGGLIVLEKLFRVRTCMVIVGGALIAADAVLNGMQGSLLLLAAGAALLLLCAAVFEYFRDMSAVLREVRKNRTLTITKHIYIPAILMSIALGAGTLFIFQANFGAYTNITGGVIGFMWRLNYKLGMIPALCGFIMTMKYILIACICRRILFGRSLKDTRYTTYTIFGGCLTLWEVLTLAGTGIEQLRNSFFLATNLELAAKLFGCVIIAIGLFDRRRRAGDILLAIGTLLLTLYHIFDHFELDSVPAWIDYVCSGMGTIMLTALCVIRLQGNMKRIFKAAALAAAVIFAIGEGATVYTMMHEYGAFFYGTPFDHIWQVIKRLLDTDLGIVFCLFAVAAAIRKNDPAKAALKMHNKTRTA